MGRNRGHWPEFQIRPHNMSSREVLMVYIQYSKWHAGEINIKICSGQAERQIALDFGYYGN